MSTLKFDNVTLKFGGITALNGVDFEVNSGELFAILDRMVLEKHQYLTALVESTDLRKVMSLMQIRKLMN